MELRVCRAEPSDLPAVKEMYAALVAPLLHRAREDRERRSRLYVALGAFGGMALCLALL